MCVHIKKGLELVILFLINIMDTCICVYVCVCLFEEFIIIII